MNTTRLLRQSGSDGRMEVSVEGGRSGMLGFTIIWIGQMLSLRGTTMTGFALTIWAWQQTGQATALLLTNAISLKFAINGLMST